MRGFKINLKPYPVETTILKGKCPTCKKETTWENKRGVLCCEVCKISPDVKDVQLKSEPGFKPYDIKDVIANVVLHPSQNHDGYRSYTVNKVVEKIMKAEDSVILERGEYEDILKKCFTSFKGYGRQDQELLKRIYEPEEVELEEKKKPVKTDKEFLKPPRACPECHGYDCHATSCSKFTQK